MVLPHVPPLSQHIVRCSEKDPHVDLINYALYRMSAQ